MPHPQRQNISLNDGEGVATTDVDGSPALRVAVVQQPPGGTGLTDAELRAAPVDVDGIVAVSNFPATQPVSGSVSVSNLPATQPVSGTVTANAGTGTMAVSGPLTDAQLRAVAVPVSGTFFQATQPVSGTVTANAGSGTFAVSGPVTDAQIRATPLPVSGTVTANAGTGTMAVSLASIPALAAGTNRAGGTYDVGGTVIDEAPAARAIGRAFANATIQGNTSVVAAQGGSTKVRVLAVFVVSSTAVSVKFQSASTDISGTFPLAANGGFSMPYNPHGWFQTAANEALNVNLSGVATNVGVNVIWAPAV